MNNLTPFPKPTSFYKAGHGHGLPHRSQSGRLPLERAGSSHLSASVAADKQGLTNIKKLAQQRGWTKVTCGIRVNEVSFTPHKNSDDVMRGEHLWYVLHIVRSF